MPMTDETSSQMILSIGISMAVMPERSPKMSMSTIMLPAVYWLMAAKAYMELIPTMHLRTASA